MMGNYVPKPHNADLRKGRFSENGRVYLVTAVTHDRRQIFMDVVPGRLLAEEFRAMEDNDQASSSAWVVMPDHFHWLLELKRGSLSEVLKSVKGRSARRINQHLGGAGAACGRLDSMTMRCGTRKICRPWLVMWWRIRCAPSW